ncbi:MAG: peroxidase-related enzyme [Acetobacteraceae bacterium]|nr:peroxidase-related enzyme [Acetobacteraceae bacterium]
MTLQGAATAPHDILAELSRRAPAAWADWRPEGKAAIAGSERAIFEGPSGLTRAERHAVAAICAELCGESELAGYHRALGEEDKATHRLPALAAHAEMLSLRPHKASRAWIQELERAHLAPRDIVMLSQLVAYVHFVARMLAALRAMAAPAVADAPPALVLPAREAGTADFGFTMEKLEWDAWAPVLDLAQAGPDEIAVLEESHPQARTSDYYLLLVQEPEVLRQRSRLFNTIMYGPRGGSRAEREWASTVESLLNGCPYCASVHAQRYVQLAKDEVGMRRLLMEGARAEMPPRLRAITDASLRLSLTPPALTPAAIGALRGQGMADEEILDVLAAVAMFAWANRLMQTLGEPRRP